LKFEEFFAARECDALSTWRNWVEQNAVDIARKGTAKYRISITNFWAYPTMSTKTLEFWYR